MVSLALWGTGAWADVTITETYDFGSFITENGAPTLTVSGDDIAQAGTSAKVGSVKLINNPVINGNTLDLKSRFAVDYDANANMQIRFMWRSSNAAYQHGLAGNWFNPGAADPQGAARFSILSLKAGDKVTITFAMQSGRTANPFTCKANAITYGDNDPVGVDEALTSGTEYTMTADGNLDLYFTNNNFAISKIVIVTTSDVAVIDPTATITGADGIARKFTLECLTEGATIYYAESELDKDANGWITYSGEASTSESTIYAYAKDNAGNSSNIISFATGAGTEVSLNAPTVIHSGINKYIIRSNQNSVVGKPTATINYQLDGVSNTSTESSVEITVEKDGSLTYWLTADGYTGTREVTIDTYAGVETTVDQTIDFRTGTDNSWAIKGEAVAINGDQSEFFQYKDQNGNIVAGDILATTFNNGDPTWRIQKNKGGVLIYNNSIEKIALQNLTKGMIIEVAGSAAPTSTTNLKELKGNSYDGMYAYEIESNGVATLEFKGSYLYFINISGYSICTLTVNTDPLGTSSVGGLENDGKYSFNGDVRISVEKEINGYEFVEWQENGQKLVTTENEPNALAFKIKTNRTIIAKYQQKQAAQTFKLTLTPNPANSGNSVKAYTDEACKTEVADYNAVSGEVWVKAFPASTNDYMFGSFNVVGVEGLPLASDNPTKFTIDKDTEIKANFTKIYALTLSVNPENSGTAKAYSDRECSKEITNLSAIPEGVEVWILATPATGYEFENWTGVNNDQIIPTDKTNVTMNNDLTFTANFKQTQTSSDDEIIALTQDMFHKWDGYGADAADLGVADVEFNVNNGVELSGGNVVCGTGGVFGTIYADLTGCTKLIIEGTPGMPLRVLLDRQGDGSGPLCEKNPVIGENGSCEVDLTDIKVDGQSMNFAHLNTIKAGYGTPGKITAIKLVKPNDPLAPAKEALKNAISKGKLQNGVAKTEDSYKALTDAIAAGQEALTAANATEQSLADAKKAIEDAIDGLTLLDGYSDLTKEMFMEWPEYGADNPTKNAGCAYVLGESTDLPYGDVNVSWLNYANLDAYESLIVTVADGTPRFCFDRTAAAGQDNEDESQSQMIDIPNNPRSTQAYQTVDGKTYTIDLKKMAEQKGHAFLHSIKGANWGKVTVTGMYLKAKTSGGMFTYYLKEGDTFTSGQTVEVKKDNDVIATITYGETGGADFKAAKADDKVAGCEAFTEGNGTNGNKTGGTFYTITPTYDGTITAAVVLNADKAFYVEEDGKALTNYDGITVSGKYYGTYNFDVKAGKSYKFYCAGSKLGFYGFNYVYSVPTTYTITAKANPTEGGTVTGAGTYNEGATVTLKATANEGYKFLKWESTGNEFKTDAEFSFSATADIEWTAQFELGTSAGDNDKYVSKEFYPAGATEAVWGPARKASDGSYVVFARGGQGLDGWDSQFFIDLGEENTLNPKDKLKLTMNVKADVAQSDIETQAHAAPGGYLHWDCVGRVNFTTEWKEFTSEITVGNNRDGMHTIAFNLTKGTENTFYFKDIKFEIERGPAWDNIANNDPRTYYKKEFPKTAPEIAEPDAQGIVTVESAARAQKKDDQGNPQFDNDNKPVMGDDWDSQFWIRLPQKVAAGEPVKVSFQYKASTDAKRVATQCHNEPGDYLHYSCLGDFDFTQEWKTYSATITVPDETKGNFHSIAFNLTKDEAVTYYFRDVKVSVLDDIATEPDYPKALVIFAAGDAQGIAPAQIEAELGSSITIPVNRTLYEEDKTLTSWNYTDGNEINVFKPTETMLVKHMVTNLNPVFTENNVSLFDREGEIVLDWQLGHKNGGGDLNYEGKTGVAVIQATIKGETIDVPLLIDATNGKANNIGRPDEWAQINKGTKFTIPSFQGTTVEMNAYEEIATTTIDGAADYEAGKTITYVIPEMKETSEIVVNDGAYYSYVKVTIPDFGPEKKITVKIFSTGTGDYTIDPDKKTHRVGEKVTITATAAEGFKFAEWLTADGASLGTENPLSIIVTDDMLIYAKFTEDDGEEDVLLGDANLDGEVTVSDAVLTVNFALGVEVPSDLQKKAADVNKDNELTVADAVGIVNIALGNDAAGVRMLDEGSNSLTLRGNELSLSNTTEFVAFQMDVTLNDGSLLNGVTLSDRASNLRIDYNRVGQNTWRIAAFSTENEAITRNSGKLVTFDISGDLTMTLTSIEFVDAYARQYPMGFGDVTGINGMGYANSNADIYTIDGVKNNTMRKGVNVVRSAAGEVKKVLVK